MKSEVIGAKLHGGNLKVLVSVMDTLSVDIYNYNKMILHYTSLLVTCMDML